LRALAGPAPELDRDGVRAALGEDSPTTASCLAGIAVVPPPRWPLARCDVALEPALRSACAELPPGPMPVALSGGLDSAVLLALLRDRAIAYTLAPALEGYDESGRARTTAEALGVPLRVVRVERDDFLDALPDAVRGAECPLWNLHPVSRLLLARRIAADGFDRVITGDGADDLLRGGDGWDHLPIVGALTREAGLYLCAPFLSVALEPLAGRDPAKRELRALGRSLGLPPQVTDGPKRPMLAPPMDPRRFWDDPLIERLGRQLGRQPSSASDREVVGWTTLALFARDLACAA